MITCHLSRDCSEQLPLVESYHVTVVPSCHWSRGWESSHSVLLGLLCYSFECKRMQGKAQGKELGSLVGYTVQGNNTKPRLTIRIHINYIPHYIFITMLRLIINSLRLMEEIRSYFTP